jgi:hypothetical protein
LPARLVVTERKGGSRIALVGASGKELLASVVFSEPRAKGATLRSLKSLLGADVVVEDHTVTPASSPAKSRTNGTKAEIAGTAKPVGESSPRGRARAAAASTADPTANVEVKPARKPRKKK